jgi:ribosome maturation factor RimP
MVPFFVGVGFNSMRDALMRLLEPPIEALNYELVDVEFAQAGRGGVLRIFIDRRAEDSSLGAELKLPIEGRRRFVGVLKSIAEDTVVVEVDGKAHSLPFERIQKARLRPE